MKFDKNRAKYFEMDYTGQSMHPTFKIGDALIVTRQRYGILKLGDVIIFHHPEKTHFVVHRIVSINTDGIRTRGDNNLHVDPWLLKEEQILGSVTIADRKGKTCTVISGTRGHIYAAILLSIKRIKLVLRRIFHHPYHIIKIITCRFISITPRVVSFTKGNGLEMHLMLGRKIIGKRRSGQEKWSIPPLYRLFIDESILP